MPKLSLASLVASLVDISLALQVQPQTGLSSLRNDQGSRTTELEWVWTEADGDTCETACASKCAGAVCDSLDLGEIDSTAKMADLEAEMGTSECTSYAVLLQGLNGVKDAGCPNNSVAFEGNCYATRNFADPEGVGSECESNHETLPDGWELATYSDELATFLSQYSWSSYGLLLLNPNNLTVCVETCTSSLSGCSSFENFSSIYDERVSVACIDDIGGYVVPDNFCSAMLIITTPQVMPTPAPTTPAPTPIPDYGAYVQDGVCYPSSGSASCTTEASSGAKLLCPCEITLGTCTLAEDPHIRVFDEAQVSLLLAGNEATTDDELIGEQWLVKSARVKVQARFENVGSSSDNKIFTRAVALGGEILNDNVITVGSLEDPITWNGKRILNDQQSSFYMREGSFFINATRGASSLVQDPSQENLGVNIRLASGVSMIVNRLHHYTNVAIRMPQQAGGQEGLCGNYNGVGADDSVEMMNDRFNPKVAPEESLFVGVSYN